MSLKSICLYLVLSSTAMLGGFASACPGDGMGASNVEAGKTTVNILTKRDGEKVRFFVDNQESCEVTVTLDLRVVNLKSDKPLPFSGSFPAKQISELLILEPEQETTGWEYSYTNYFKLGSSSAQHDDSHQYLLPYLPGYRFKVTQAYNGTYSHKGSNKYAIDWKMPEGTIVCAARDGEVVKLKEDSDNGGPSAKFDSFNNYVLVRHADGTLGHYCHLQQNGVLVQLGDRVVAGQAIALSGNTGYSSGPHLHFCVFRTKNGRQRESVPIRFRTADDLAVTLIEDGRYRAAQIPLPTPVPLDRVAGEPVAGEGKGGEAERSHVGG